MAMLFDRDEKTIRKHINNVFSDCEVEKESNTHFLRLAHSDKPVAFYTLDVIISVGYRVKSQRGVQFRQWANGVLKQYLLKGYAVNERLRREQIGELRQLVQLVGRTLHNDEMATSAETQDLLDVVVDYAYALDTLDNYDYERLTIEKTTKEEPFHATYEGAMAEIARLRDKFGGSALFGNEKDESFKSSIGQIYQTFGGEELYPSVEEKAAMLLYLVTKTIRLATATSALLLHCFFGFSMATVCFIILMATSALPIAHLLH